MRKNIIQIFEVGTNIATGGSGLRPNFTPIPEVGTGIDTEGYVRKNIIQIFEVGTGIDTEGGADFVRTLHQYLKYGRILSQRATCVAQKNSRINYPTLYFLVKKYNN